MNALITDANPLTAARNLEQSRCHRQAFEAQQMLWALTGIKSTDFYFHAAQRCSVRYWQSNTWWLASFGNACAWVAIEERSEADNVDLQGFFSRQLDYHPKNRRPWFLQRSQRHITDTSWVAHQKALLCSKAQHYRDLWPDVTPDPVRYYPVAGEPGTFVTRGD